MPSGGKTVKKGFSTICSFRYLLRGSWNVSPEDKGTLLYLSHP